MMHLLSLLKKIVFSTIGDHIRPGSFKRTMDIAFVLFEKIAFSFKDATKFYISVYRDMVQNELQLLKNYNLSKILVIGSGSIPATPILIAKHVEAHVDCIDIDKDAIEKSKTLIKQLQLDDKIKIKSGDGKHCCFNGYDAIFILYGMISQQDILTAISQSLAKNTPIILRVVPKKDKALIDNNPFDLSVLFLIKNKVRSHSWGVIDSYLLEQKK